MSCCAGRAGRAEPSELNCCQTGAGYRWPGVNTLTLKCNREPLPEELPGVTCNEQEEDGDWSCVFDE